MTSLINAFVAPSRAGNAWFHAGLTTSFPNITESGSTVLAETLPCKRRAADDSSPSSDSPAPSSLPGCRVFYVPREDSSKAVEVSLAGADDDEEGEERRGLQDQVLVFQYKGKFHAVDHKCPHQSYPLSNGTPFDIEDFGLALSAGLHCPKHGWSFDLFRGNGDRGNYRLKVWEVQLRRVVAGGAEGDYTADEGMEEVWVRRKQRMG